MRTDVTFNTGNCILEKIFVVMTNSMPRSALRSLDDPYALSLKNLTSFER
jgi:hypothetical protein